MGSERKVNSLLFTGQLFYRTRKCW